MRLDVSEKLDLGRIQSGTVRGIALLGDQFAVLVDHADVQRVELRDAGRHQIDDARDLNRFQRAPGVQTDQHRGRGFLVIAQEGRLFRNRQMHSSRAHRGQGLDRTRQLALQRPLVVDLLGELADAELLRLHQFEAYQAAFGQPLRRQAQPRVVHDGLRHQNAVPTIAEAVRDVLLRQRRHDLSAVLFVLDREQQRKRWIPGPQPAANQHREQ